MHLAALWPCYKWRSCTATSLMIYEQFNTGQSGLFRLVAELQCAVDHARRARARRRRRPSARQPPSQISIILCVFIGANSLSILACRFSFCNASMWRVAIVSACALLCHDAAAGTLPLPLECTCHVSTCARRQSQLVYNGGVTLLRSLRGSALGVGAGSCLQACQAAAPRLAVCSLPRF